MQREVAYAVASFRCRIALCSCSELVAWRGDKLQRYGATRYENLFAMTGSLRH
jgi:hypothetical protein